MTKSVKVAAINCDSYEPDKLQSALKELLAPLGGIEAFVKKSQRVLIKPNLLMASPPAKAVTTHPELILQVAKLVLSCNPDLIHIGDNPATEKAETVMHALGVKELDSKTGIVEFSDYRTVQNHFGGAIKRFKFAHDVFNYDVVINLPKLKTHCQMTMTLAVKNWFGLVNGEERVKLHLRGGFEYELFADLLIDVLKTRPPDLNILDGIVGMEGEGPAGGEACQMNTLLASGSAFALDEVAVSLAGHKADRVPTVRKAKERGITPEYEVKGSYKPPLKVMQLPLIMDVSFVAKLPKPLQSFFKNLILARPRLSEPDCIHCKGCFDICPPKAIEWDKEAIPVIDYNKCIRCYCCIEVCPNRALNQYESIWGRGFRVIKPLIKAVLKPVMACHRFFKFR